MCQSASSAIVPSSVITTDSAGSTITSAASVTVPASQVSAGGKTSFLTVTVTNSNGQTQESVVSSVSPSSKSSTNIGAIVGGTVGGVVGLVAILALLWFCVFKKRRNHKDDFDDTMFNPGRNRHAAPGQTDILDDEANNDNVEPYTYGQNAAATSPQMSQYATAGGYPASSGIAPSLPPLTAMGGASTAIAAAGPLTARTGSFSETSQSGARGVARGPSSASTLTSAGFAGRGAQPQPGQMPYNGYYQSGSGGAPAMPMPMPVPYGQQQQQQPPSGAQQKAREAAQERQALRAANPSASDGYYAPATATSTTTTGAPSQPASGQVSPGATTTTSGGVYVHSDRGRYVPEPEEADAVDDGPSELPPQ
ncbi:hypothetical protein QFC24_006285 [Naganishia onofrii]|uniref:Uncharacterized protein n=1 Tax=Naganishia onofrii TaxID=1851511 RepID=A0ACC2X1V9_9TREE|nr:hypothetical protein QFC24_006285 [Naganishia onofrii]